MIVVLTLSPVNNSDSDSEWLSNAVELVSAGEHFVTIQGFEQALHKT